MWFPKVYYPKAKSFNCFSLIKHFANTNKKLQGECEWREDQFIQKAQCKKSYAFLSVTAAKRLLSLFVAAFFGLSYQLCSELWVASVQCIFCFFNNIYFECGYLLYYDHYIAIYV
jgi:hypothetical protein